MLFLNLPPVRLLIVLINLMMAYYFVLRGFVFYELVLVPLLAVYHGARNRSLYWPEWLSSHKLRYASWFGKMMYNFSVGVLNAYVVIMALVGMSMLYPKLFGQLDAPDKVGAQIGLAPDSLERIGIYVLLALVGLTIAMLAILLDDLGVFAEKKSHEAQLISEPPRDIREL